jgi:tetratricopeptide (TPR) repeat protein
MPRQKSTHVDSPEAVGRRLKEARERAGLSQRALSFSGCSPAYISRIEAGDRIPSLQLLRELGRRLGVSEDYLATGSETIPARSALLVDAEIALRLDDLDRARGLYERALAEANGPTERAEALEGLGSLELREGRPAEAVELLEQALTLFGGDPASRPSLAEGLGRAHAALGEFAPAIALFRRCAETFDAAGDVLGSIRFACLLGYALTDSGNFAEAESVVAKALVAGREVADPYTRARLYWSQSRLLLEQGKATTAERYARGALETLRATEDTYALGLAHQLLALVYLEVGRPGEALELLEEAWPLIAASATPVELAEYRVEEARALAALGERERAAALAMAATAGLKGALAVDAGRSYVLLAGIFTELGEPDRARELYELGIERLEEWGPSRYLVDAYGQLARLLEDAGHTDEALDVLKRALRVQQRTGKPIA